MRHASRVAALLAVTTLTGPTGCDRCTTSILLVRGDIPEETLVEEIRVFHLDDEAGDTLVTEIYDFTNDVMPHGTTKELVVPCGGSRIEMSWSCRKVPNDSLPCKPVVGEVFVVEGAWTFTGNLDGTYTFDAR